jgi:hypothetical protein
VGNVPAAQFLVDQKSLQILYIDLTPFLPRHSIHNPAYTASTAVGGLPDPVGKGRQVCEAAALFQIAGPKELRNPWGREGGNQRRWGRETS